MKTIVAHMSPDLDAVMSVWLLKRYRKDWADATYAFVPAGETLEGKPVDSDPEIAHVDTGLGLFDHHQFKDNGMCAAKRVYDYLVEHGEISKDEQKAVGRLVAFACIIDNFREAYFPDPADDRYDFTIDRILSSLKSTGVDDTTVVEIGLKMLDATLSHFRNKIKAEKEIETGYVFESRWGKTLAIESGNHETSRLALKSGFDMTVAKDPGRGNIRIHTFPKDEIDITPLHEKLKEVEPGATWFLHISRHMILNGSQKNPNSVPSKLPLQKVIEIIKGM